MRLKDKVIVVTGGGTGIGLACCEEFARQGASVVLSGRRQDVIDSAAAGIAETGGRAIAIAADVGRKEETQNLIQGAVKEFGRLDVLVNCAGQELVANIVDTTEEQWDRVMDTNLKSIYFLSREALPHMIKQGSGNILNVASQLAFVGAPNFAAYTASKGAVINLTRSMALDHATQGIRVNALCPGAVETPLLLRQFEDSDGPQGTLQDLADMHAVKRLGQPIEIAHAAVFLVSDEASFVTGASLIADGGYTAW